MKITIYIDPLITILKNKNFVFDVCIILNEDVLLLRMFLFS